MNFVEIDDIDKNIIRIIQLDASLPIQDIAEQVGLTTNPCWRRIRKLEAAGVIVRRVAVIDPAVLGLGMTAFVRIRTDRHTKEWVDLFNVGVRRIPEIVECHRMTGDVDYFLKIIVRDLSHYDTVYQRMLQFVPDIGDMSAAFSMELITGTGAIDMSTL